MSDPKFAPITVVLSTTPALLDDKHAKMTVGAPVKWYEDHAKLVGFASVLAARGTFDVDDCKRASVESVIAFFEKPWKWNAEYEEWKAL